MNESFYNEEGGFGYHYSNEAYVDEVLTFGTSTLSDFKVLYKYNDMSRHMNTSLILISTI